jgi:very-short-patch-repair endonuclease
MQKVWEDPDQLAQRSKSMTARWADPAYQERQRQIHADPERRAQWSAKAKAQWEAMTPEQRAASLKRAHGAIRSGSVVTKPEGRVAVALNDLDIDYQLHAVIGPYVMDFRIKNAMLNVEVDGAFWHRQRPEHDAARDAYMTEHGYRVVRILDTATQAEIETMLREALAT